MIKLFYKIPKIPPSNNKFIGRRNNWEYQKIKKEWAELIAIYCILKPKKPIQHAKVTLTYFFPDKRRRDPDNYSGKMILDALVIQKILVDDSFKNVNLELKAITDKENPRLEIEIEEIAE